MTTRQNTFVVGADAWRVFLVPLVLLGVTALFPLPGVLLFIDPCPPLLRLEPWLLAILLIGLGILIFFPACRSSRGSR